MSNASDIKNLFSGFGGNSQHYRELVLENDAQDSAARWPLLASIANSKKLVPDTNAAPAIASPFSRPQSVRSTHEAPPHEASPHEAPPPLSTPNPDERASASDPTASRPKFAFLPSPQPSETKVEQPVELSETLPKKQAAAAQTDNLHSVLRRLAAANPPQTSKSPLASSALSECPVTTKTSARTVTSVLSRLAKR